MAAKLKDLQADKSIGALLVSSRRGRCRALGIKSANYADANYGAIV